jgi:3'(2'), 5'-bisphosphate nucleotidase
MESKYEEFFSLIEKSESIVIFGHIYPDGDCYGSSEGLKYALLSLYPEKKIFVSKTDWRGKDEKMPYADEVDDQTISSSLHIIVDLPDKKRIGDPRAFALPNKGMIKVDHHFFVEEFGGLEIVDDKRASCSDLLADILYSKTSHLPSLASQMFFLGLTTDSGRYQFACDPKILAISSKLVEDGAKPMEIFDLTNAASEMYMRYKGYLLSNFASTLLGVCYCKVSYQDAQKYGLDGHGAALGVNTIGNIDASRLFVVFGEDKDGKVFCELRSKGDVDVHDIAVRFGGGGHFNASGCTLKNMKEADSVIKACEDKVLDSFAPYQKELSTLLELGKQASDIIMNFYSKGFEVETKEDNSPVTSADKASDKLIRDTLIKEFPSYGLLTEEDADDKIRLSKDKVFIIDPLDGTTDYVGRDDMFCVNLALVQDHHPVVSVVAVPCKGDLYFAVKGKGAYVKLNNRVLKKIHVSHRHSPITVYASKDHQNPALNAAFEKHKDELTVKRIGSALKACLIASGQGEACYSIGKGTKEWDTCAPQLIVEEAGGIYHQNHKDPITYNRDDVYNEDGFTILAQPFNDIIPMSEIESFKK